jgi:hypothetical protein
LWQWFKKQKLHQRLNLNQLLMLKWMKYQLLNQLLNQ